jgi:hypothetical protein
MPSRAAAASWLHPVPLPGEGHGFAIDLMFERGHISHLALAAA